MYTSNQCATRFCLMLLELERRNGGHNQPDTDKGGFRGNFSRSRLLGTVTYWSWKGGLEMSECSLAWGWTHVG